MANQLNFKLHPREKSKRYYFIVHTGINDSWEKSLQTMRAFYLEQNKFFILYVTGELGSGKSYFIDCFLEEAEDIGCRMTQIKKFEFQRRSPSEDEISSFIAEYEKLKAHGGIAIIESPFLPKNLTENPHLLSRILSAEVCALDFPQEEELSALINSLLERNNIRLSTKDVEYILNRSASDPLSLSLISARIDELLLTSHRVAKSVILKKVFE